MLRFWLVEAAQATARSIPEWRSKFFHLAMRRGRKIAKVAMARKLAVRLFWMMRQEWNYEQVQKFGSQGRQSGCTIPAVANSSFRKEGLYDVLHEKTSAV